MQLTEDKTMIVTVTDDAMEQPGSKKSVRKGEDVLIDVRAPVVSGDVVAACHDGRMVIRVYEQRGSKSFLVPLNPAYKRIAANGTKKILGRADVSETGRGAIRLLHAFRAMNEAQKALLVQSISDLADLRKEDPTDAALQEYTAQLIEKMKAAA